LRGPYGQALSRSGCDPPVAAVGTKLMKTKASSPPACTIRSRLRLQSGLQLQLRQPPLRGLHLRT